MLSVRHLTVNFARPEGSVTAVDSIDLDISAGEIVSIVGESGSGKTTLALALTGLLPDGGSLGPETEIELGGRRIDRLSPREMTGVRGKRIGFMFQNPRSTLHPQLTIGRQIQETVLAHHAVSPTAATERTTTLLADVAVPDPERRCREYPHQLSGGLLQRAAIAMALAGEPQLLIADEPTAALDTVTGWNVLLELVRLVSDRDMALLLITHDLRVAARLAARTMIMYAGRKIEELPATTNMSAARHPYARALANTWQRGGALSVIPGMPPVPEALPTGCRFHPRCAFVEQRCRAEIPPRRQAAAGHEYECWLEALP
ncbi:MAG: ABC transporter ATP-binding protein [Gemmatimonadales bacterium]